MALKFTKSTDSEHEVKLDSELISVSWTCGMAIGGQAASFEILTEMVGEGAPVKVSGESENGKNLGSVTGVMRRNSFTGAFDIPEDIQLGDKAFFSVELSKNGLDGESEHIPAYPPIRVSNMNWGAQEARRGDILQLTADIKGLPNETEVTIIIYEHDRDSAHDRITEFPAVIDSEKIEVAWEYEYHEDTDEIPTQEEFDKYNGQYNPPEYFFTIKAEGTEYGKEQESGLLEFKDWIELNGQDAYGNPLSDGDYILTLPDGTERKGKLDSSGIARISDVPPGACYAEFPPKEDEDDSDSSQSVDGA